jgi:hypothetical protein
VFRPHYLTEGCWGGLPPTYFAGGGGGGGNWGGGGEILDPPPSRGSGPVPPKIIFWENCLVKYCNFVVNLDHSL